MTGINTGQPEQLWESLAESVVKMDEKRIITLANEVIERSFSPREAIFNGLTEGMRRVGEYFAQKIYFVPEVLVCAQTMYAGFDILKKHVQEEEFEKSASVVIGVVNGDHHDIGKNIVGLMLRSSGLNVHDLGTNVSTEDFLNAIRETKPALVALSTLMSTTLESMEETVTAIRARFSEDRPKIMVGGAPVAQSYADKIGADYYGEDAQSAVAGAKRLIGLS